METFPDLPPPPERPPGTIRLVLVVSIPDAKAIHDYIAISDIEPPITHARLWRATRRMANYIMHELVGAGEGEPDSDGPEEAE